MEKHRLPPSTVEQALALVQGFDPIGVAARDLRECLLIQLRDSGHVRPAIPKAVEILDQHFDALQRGMYSEIARALKTHEERVVEAVHEISRLEPRPGRGFAPVDTRQPLPDVLVKNVGGDYAVILNEHRMPRLRIHSYYRGVIAQEHETRRYVEDRLRSAVWLIKSIQQRQKTLYKVTHSIVQFQREFLDKGLPYLRPLSLRDVAEDIHMHESTVNRVITDKFVETPQGIFPLRLLFGAPIDDPPDEDDPPDGDDPPEPEIDPPTPAAAASGSGVVSDWTDVDGRRSPSARPRIVKVYPAAR